MAIGFHAMPNLFHLCTRACRLTHSLPMVAWNIVFNKFDRGITQRLRRLSSRNDIIENTRQNLWCTRYLLFPFSRVTLLFLFLETNVTIAWRANMVFPTTLFITLCSTCTSTWHPSSFPFRCSPITSFLNRSISRYGSLCKSFVLNWVKRNYCSRKTKL